MISKQLGPTAHCNPIDPNRMFVQISYINPKLTVDDFHNPWSYQIDTESMFFSQTQTQYMIINHFFTSLETNARRFGLKSNSNMEKKLVRNPVVRVDTSSKLNIP